MGLTKRQKAARKAAETRRRNLRKQGKPKPKKAKSRSGSEAARKAWATRRKRVAVGFYKDEKDKTRPVTKSTAELKRKKVIKKPRSFKPIKPKARPSPLSKWFPKGAKYDEHGVYEFLAQYDSIVKKEAAKGKTTTLKRLLRQIEKRFGKKVGKKWRSRISPEKVKWAQTVPLERGELKKHGYDPHTSVFKRHAALNKSVAEDGLMTVRRRLQYLVNVAKDGTKLDKIYKEDLAWLKKKKPKRKAEQLKMIMERAKGKKPRKVSKREVPARELKSKAKKRHLGVKSCTHTKELHAQGIGEIKPINPKVFRLPPKKTWTRRSKSNPNKKYTVRLNQDNSLSCNCPGWIFSKG